MSGRRGRGRAAGSLLGRFLAVVLVGVPAATGLAPAGGSAMPTADDDAPLKALVVLDVSGSMARDGGGGQSLLAGAKGALSELVQSLPDDTEVGLRVYGSDYGGRDRKKACRDTRLAVPVTRLNPRRIRDSVTGLEPKGDTPISRSLQRAYGDLEDGRASRRVVVLISDGEDNCSPPAPPPCKVAGSLDDRGIDVQIETIGVALEGKPGARRALECISRETDGNYYDARNTDALTAALERISGDTLGGLKGGRGVVGGRTAARGPILEPGTYKLSLRPGEQAWFRFRTVADDRPRVLATVEGVGSLRVPRRSRDCPAWRAELYNPYGEGGTYPPYGNSGIFDGVGFGVTGASSTNAVEKLPVGIDYTGTWAVQLSLAADTLDTCSEHLGGSSAFTSRFTISTDAAPGRRSDVASASRRDASTDDEDGDAEEDARSGSTPTADETAGPSAADKYRNPVSEGSAPGWSYPVIALGVLGGLAAVTGAALVIARRRRRGW